MRILTVQDFLGAFAKLQTATVGFIMSVCVSACPSVHPSINMLGRT